MEVRYYITKDDKNVEIAEDIHPLTYSFIAEHQDRIVKDETTDRLQSILYYYVPEEEYNLFKKELTNDGYNYDGINIYIGNGSVALQVMKLV